MPRLASVAAGAWFLLGADCEFYEPEPLPQGTFTLRLSGAIDTVMTGGPGRWVDLVHPGESPEAALDHGVQVWADPPAGQATAPRVSMGVTPGEGAPGPAPGVTYRLGTASSGATGSASEGEVVEPEGLGGSLLVGCRTTVTLPQCEAALAMREGSFARLTLTRVDADTVAGRGEFEATGWLSGTATIGPPPDTVRVVIEFVLPRGTDRSIRHPPGS